MEVVTLIFTALPLLQTELWAKMNILFQVSVPDTTHVSTAWNSSLFESPCVLLPAYGPPKCAHILGFSNSIHVYFFHESFFHSMSQPCPFFHSTSQLLVPVIPLIRIHSVFQNSPMVGSCILLFMFVFCMQDLL